MRTYGVLFNSQREAFFTGTYVRSGRLPDLPITLLICEHFYRLDEMYQMPKSYTLGDVLIEFPEEIESSLFLRNL